MNQNSQKFCFCTLALGKKYHTLALELAKDIKKYSPGTTFLILTDRPDRFKNIDNVIAFKHQPESIKFYHDKRFVIEKAMSLFNTCIFLDADMRILAPVSSNLEWLPGITARTGSHIIKHNQRKNKELEIIHKISNKLGLELDRVKFVHEFLFVVTRDRGNELEFLKQWETIGRYFEVNGIYAGEGNAIGLAAAKVNFPVRFDSVDRFSFFKDRIERVRIKKGQVNPQDKSIYFEKQKQLEFPKYTRVEKILVNLSNRIGTLFRLVRLKIISLNNFSFYYR
jgi:TusA-related sulfurtransferase